MYMKLYLYIHRLRVEWISPGEFTCIRRQLTHCVLKKKWYINMSWGFLPPLTINGALLPPKLLLLLPLLPSSSTTTTTTTTTSTTTTTTTTPPPPPTTTTTTTTRWFIRTISTSRSPPQCPQTCLLSVDPGETFKQKAQGLEVDRFDNTLLEPRGFAHPKYDKKQKEQVL